MGDDNDNDNLSFTSLVLECHKGKTARSKDNGNTSYTDHFGGKLKELRLGGGRVSQKQHIDITSPACAVR